MKGKGSHNSFWFGIDVAVALEGAVPSDWAKLEIGHFEMNGEGMHKLALWLEPSL